ncbi:GDSL esterase/lipase [Platanthera guangdongensis]|uniref:GDSL esterase/lipase n=1 Tax=Platanthera guangdongensis TaxID=2320717 RepID=A0ABR2LCH4_9ASPA
MSSSGFLPPLFLFLLATSSADGCFTSIFSFGDSIADTGNLLISQKGEIPAARSPYGRTYFHRPTGRFSDGRLIIDFIAEALGFPYIRPYLAGPGDGGFRRGVNFAVAGATALDKDFLAEMGIETRFTNLTLQVQFGWFKELLPSLCSTDSVSSCYSRQPSAASRSENSRQTITNLPGMLIQIPRQWPVSISVIRKGARRALSVGLLVRIRIQPGSESSSVFYLICDLGFNNPNWSGLGYIPRLEQLPGRSRSPTIRRITVVRVFARGGEPPHVLLIRAWEEPPVPGEVVLSLLA